MRLPILYIVIPCYNEQEVLPKTAPDFLAQLRHMVAGGKIHSQSRILFVNDGSRDQTWNLIQSLSDAHPEICGVSLSRNRGHQNALVAGLLDAMPRCDITISIDCDGQDDITVMDQMVDAYLDGCDIVYGVRANRDTDTWFKRTTAQLFYKAMRTLGVESVYNHADYRLVSRRALEAFAQYQEVNLYLRGMFPLVGFKSTAVQYDRKCRVSGESHYPLSKMLGLALDGITSLSVKPLRIIAATGFAIAGLSAVGILWAIVQYFLNRAVAGWASTICVICFLTGVQLLSLGVVGEYVGKIFMEVKHRPRYIIAERAGIKEEHET